MSKLPDDIVQDLNAVGLGGRLVYVPLLGRKTISDEIYDAMISMLKDGKEVDLDAFRNMVSLRTLYRLRTKALEEFGRLKDLGQSNDKKGQK